MEKEILEGNKLIAAFIDEVYKTQMGNIVNFINKPSLFETSNSFEVDELQYHTSWDWLIPVYNKILALFNSDKELLKKLKENRLILNCVKTVLDASDVSLQIEIYSSFLKVCDIIKWYNSTKKPKIFAACREP